MTIILEQQQIPSVSVQQTQNELVKRILKLRWIGMHEEATQLQHEVLKNTPADTVLSVPADTD